MKRFSNILTTLFAAVFAFAASCVVAKADPSWMEKIDNTGRQRFDQIVRTVDYWTPGQADAIKADIQAFIDKYPKFVPAQVEAARAEWLRIGHGMGVALASKSFFTVFESLQKSEPSYAPAYVYGARCYIFAGYPAGARKQLEKALELDPTNPWVDLSLSLMFERLGDRQNALVWARSALPKTTLKPESMATAILSIANQQAINSNDVALALAGQIQTLQTDADKLTNVVSMSLDGYQYQSGLLQVLNELTTHIAGEKKPSSFLLLQIARLNLNMGYMYTNGIKPKYQPQYAAVALSILEKIKDDQAVETTAWWYRFQLALGRGDVQLMSQLLDEAGLKNFDTKWIGYQQAKFLYVQGRYRELMDLYMKLKLPEDDLVAQANEVAGDLAVADRVYRRDLETNPTSVTVNAHYAEFRLYRFRDIDGAIAYAEKAYSALPSPRNRYTLTIALLVRSHDKIKLRNFTMAKEAFARARQIGIDRPALQGFCA